jgi:hypothetical protein
MKAFFDFGRNPGWQLKTIALLLTSFALATAGCGKANTPAASATPSQSTVVAATPAPTPAPTAQPIPMQTVATTSSNNAPTSLQLLNRAMVGWMRQNHRHPQNFEDFASSANIQIPDPPPGKKYALNGRGFIVLVDNQ